jgi:DNA-binding transcriptional regulator YhcF (GntR family)
VRENPQSTIRLIVFQSWKPLAGLRRSSLHSSLIRVSVAIQFTSQVLPPSSENACSKWHELGVMRSKVVREKHNRVKWPPTIATQLCYARATSRLTVSMKRVPATFIPPTMLDNRGKSPIYRQLYDWLRVAITEGRIRPGQRVPSTRSMAAELQISRISVFNAYEQLRSEGYLEAFVGSGTCVVRTIPDDAFGLTTHKRKGLQRVNAESGPRTVSARAVALLKVPSEAWLHNLGPREVIDDPTIDSWCAGSSFVLRCFHRPVRLVVRTPTVTNDPPFP